MTITPPHSPERTFDATTRTTAGVIAIGNLQAQIEGLQGEAAAHRLTAEGTSGLVELLLLRGHILGRVRDYELAGRLTAQLIREGPSGPAALLARSRTRAALHRFVEALADLDDAAGLGADPSAVDAERAVIFQALGRYDEALAIFSEVTNRRADFSSLGNLATLQAERGDTALAEHLFKESRRRYRGVSPIPVAQLDFKEAQMWIAEGDLHRARGCLEAAVHRLPAYAPAEGHLAEVEAALGQTDSAVDRLLPLTTSSDDPDYAAQLARILGEAGRVEEASQWRNRAAAGYDALVASHLEAFADHAAEFWLEAGSDPRRALQLASANYQLRPTGRARQLLDRATQACEKEGMNDVR